MSRAVRERKVMTAKEKELLAKAMARFNWGRVWDAMNAVNWHWVSSNGVPEIADMKRVVNYLALALCQYPMEEREKHTASTGGFLIGAYGEGFCIQFVLAESDNDLELGFAMGGVHAEQEL